MSQCFVVVPGQYLAVGVLVIVIIDVLEHFGFGVNEVVNTHFGTRVRAGSSLVRRRVLLLPRVDNSNLNKPKGQSVLLRPPKQGKRAVSRHNLCRKQVYIKLSTMAKLLFKSHFLRRVISKNVGIYAQVTEDIYVSVTSEQGRMTKHFESFV